MNVKEMHFDFKKKLNKVDSQKNRNLLIPEIDWVLNEAQELFIKRIAEPHSYSYMGFEKSQRNIDDLNTIVINKNINVVNNIVTLPEDYMYYVRGRVTMNKQGCGENNGVLYIRQHDDEFEESPFDKSSYEWRTVNGVFNNKGLELFDDGTFINNSLLLTYIKKPVYIHNAEDFRTNGYKLPSGNLLLGHQNCELPEHTHRYIVDLAVLITSGELEMRSYSIHSNKIQIQDV